jgi:hypothetical protein
MENFTNETKINCLVFQKNYSQLADIKKKIDCSARPIEKSIFAEEMDEIIESLQHCPRYDKLTIDCHNCNMVINAQRKAVDMFLGLKVTA